MVHRQLAGNALYEIATADGNQREAAAENLQRPYRRYDVITAMTTAKHQQSRIFSHSQQLIG